MTPFEIKLFEEMLDGCGWQLLPEGGLCLRVYAEEPLGLAGLLRACLSDEPCIFECSDAWTLYGWIHRN